VLNGKAIIRGFDLDRGRADVDGWYYLDGALVTLPRAQFADGSTIHSSQPVQSYILHDYDPVTASFKDLFAGAAATHVTARSPDLGTSWTDVSVLAQKMRTNGSGKGYFSASGAPSLTKMIYTATSAPSSADCFVEVQVDTFDQAGSDAFGIFARYQSATSMYYMGWGRDGSAEQTLYLSVDRVTGAGAGTSVISLIHPAYISGMKLRLTCLGTTISAWVKYPGDGTWTLLAWATDSGIALAGNCGIATGSVSSAIYQATDSARFSNYRDGNMHSAFTFGGPEYPAVVLVRYSSGSWEYDDTTGWVAFTPTDSMTQRVPSTDVQTVIVRAAFVGEAQRFVTTSDTAVQTRHKLAREREVSSLLDNASDATTENARQFALLDAKWDIYRVPVQRIAVDDYRLRLGDTVTLKLNRFGLTTGKDMIIGGMATGADADETILTLWG
jgi:hypothetical protein